MGSMCCSSGGVPIAIDHNVVDLHFECHDDTPYNECQYVHRLRETMVFYQRWMRTHSDDDGAEVGIYEYIRKIKTPPYSVRRLLDDYHHLISVHLRKVELDDIYAYFCAPLPSDLLCDIHSCAMIHRNHRDRGMDQADQLYFKQARNEIITEQILDQMHCYVYHTFDAGLKLTRHEKAHIEEQLEADAATETVSDHRRQLITAKMQQKKALRSELRKAGGSGSGSRKRMDEESNKFMSHFGNEMDAELKDDERGADMHLYSFGVKYYYNADKYRDNGDVDVEFNVGDTYADWFVAAKYDSLKQELVHNTLCTMSLASLSQLKLRCEQLLKTRHVRQECGDMPLECLLAMTVYCNCTHLQGVLTRTYRHLRNESNGELKARHREMARLGQTLQRCVERHGTRVKSGDTERFYHGIDAPMLFTSTLNRFFGPLSTSSEYEVSAGFATQMGMILELKDGTLLASHAAGIYFDCELISDFGYEKEKFFIGGQTPLKIVGIFHLQLKANYRALVQIINNLLSVLKGDLSVRKRKAQKAMVKLLKHRTGESPLSAMPRYMDALFARICAGIKLVVNKFNVTFASTQYEVLASYLCAADCHFFRLDLLMELFPNLTSISVERNVLTPQLFDALETYLRVEFEAVQLKPRALNNVIFKSPVVGQRSLTFKQIVSKYSDRYSCLDWTVRISKKDKKQDSDWLIVESIHNRVDQKQRNILIGERVLARTEQYLLNNTSIFAQ